MSGRVKRGRWLRLALPGLMALALALGVASTASASSAPAGDATAQAAYLPAQEGEDGDNDGKPGDGREGRQGRGRPHAKRVVTLIATAVCENQGLFTDAQALPVLCTLYQGDVLPDTAKHSLAITIVKYVRHSAPEALRALVDSLDIERPGDGDQDGERRPPFGRGQGRGPGPQSGFGQQGGFGQVPQGQPQS